MQLMRSELMSHHNEDYATIALKGDQTTRIALDTLPDCERWIFKPVYQAQCVWGTDHEDSWIVVADRLYVQDKARRVGLATLLTKRIMEELVKMAGQAGKAVTVLCLLAPPEKEIVRRTMGLSSDARREVQEQYVRLPEHIGGH